MSYPVKLMIAVNAREGVDRSELKKYWIHKHAPILLRMKHLMGYTLNVMTDQLPADEVVCDGIAELWWENMKAMETDFKDNDGADVFGSTAYFTVNVLGTAEEHIIKKCLDDGVAI